MARTPIRLTSQRQSLTPSRLTPVSLRIRIRRNLIGDGLRGALDPKDR